MAKKPKIRITKHDKEEFSRLVRNTRAKISRTKKKYNIDLSNDVTLPTLESFSTRKEFNAWKDQVKSFTSRYNLEYQFVENKYGVVASKKELAEIKRDTKRAQRIAQERIDIYKERPFHQDNKPAGTVGQRTGHFSVPDVMGINVPKDFDFDTARTRSRVETVKSSMKRKGTHQYYDERTERMKENFITALEGSFNSLADDIVEEVKDLTPDEFYDLYLQHAEFDFKLLDSEGDHVLLMEGELDRMRKSLDLFKRDDPLRNF